MAGHDQNEPYDSTLTFPNLAWQIIAFFCFAICLTLNSGLIALRAKQHKVLTTFNPLSSFWLCDLCTVVTFSLSYVFIILNGFLTYGYGTNHTPTCDASVTVCISVFVLAKVVLYLFYLERTHILRSDGEPTFLGRFKSKRWLGGFLIFALGVPCAILLGFSRQFDLVYRNDEAVGCHVALRYAFATPIIVWAAVINSYLLGCYIFDLKTSYRRLSTRTCVAVVISGVSTVINLSVLLILRGEHGIECLLCCSIDMLANALALAYCTSNQGEASFYIRSDGESAGSLSRPETPTLDIKVGMAV